MAGKAKFWVNPDIRVAYNDGFDARTLRLLLQEGEAHRSHIERRWHEFFG